MNNIRIKSGTQKHCTESNDTYVDFNFSVLNSFFFRFRTFLNTDNSYKIKFHRINHYLGLIFNKAFNSTGDLVGIVYGRLGIDM